MPIRQFLRHNAHCRTGKPSREGSHIPNPKPRYLPPSGSKRLQGSASHLRGGLAPRPLARPLLHLSPRPVRVPSTPSLCALHPSPGARLVGGGATAPAAAQAYPAPHRATRTASSAIARMLRQIGPEWSKSRGTLSRGTFSRFHLHSENCHQFDHQNLFNAPEFPESN